MLSFLSRVAWQWARRAPWTPMFGLARSLIALGTLMTLLFTPTASLFHPVLGQQNAPACHAMHASSLFCLAGQHLEWARWLAVAVLALVVVGWRARWTALPHWYVTWSVHASISVSDGGDQIASILTLLMLPLALGDSRRWHWNTAPVGMPSSLLEAVSRLVGHTALGVLRLQVAVVYFHAAVGKFAVPEWVDGTALYYWLHDANIGLAPWLKPVFDPLLASPMVVALTWGTLALELTLALCLTSSRRLRLWVAVCAVGFHVGIAVVFGLVSFGLSMLGALVFLLLFDVRAKSLVPRWRFSHANYWFDAVRRARLRPRFLPTRDSSSGA